MEAIFHAMWSPGIPVLEKILRPIIVYLFLIIAMRLAGKRELAQLSTLDLVVMLTLSNAVQNAIIGSDNSVTGGIIGATALLASDYVATRVMFRYRAVDRLLEGEPTLLVEHGEILRQNLNREMITEAELMSAIRRQGIDHIADVEKVILETGGTISVFQREPTREERLSRDIAKRLDTIEHLLHEITPGAPPAATNPKQG